MTIFPTSIAIYNIRLRLKKIDPGPHFAPSTPSLTAQEVVTLSYELDVQ